MAGDSRRGLAFAGVVAVLAAVGVYLTMMPGGDSRTETSPSKPAAAGQPSTAADQTRDPAQPSQVPSQIAPPQASPDARGFDVYSYLPVSREDLAAAADVARRFTASYATFRYDEDPVSYATRLKNFATAEFGDSLTRTVTAPALVQRNQVDQVVSAGSAKVKTIRDMSYDSVVFVVTATAHVSAKSGDTEQADDYAVTVSRDGAVWRVYDMEPADAGQDGDTTP
ncbi:hypothetical protein J5X84_32435 [Streptosporangiaceae bacterium NEAU-GS5]|nr:hypothetical protein [Streptosporangiaceae bacterium NEAU-GS5]